MLFGLLLIIVSTSFTPKTFWLTGNWEFEESDQTIFNLDFTQNGSKISGSHCSSQYAGQKIDCSLDGDAISITGTIGKADSVLVVFKSSFSGKTGRAVIKKLSATQIQWTIRQEPKGEYYIPTNTILTRQ